MTTLVGRGHELAVLLHLLNPPGDHERRLIFVAGEAGIGKTRLVEEALRGEALSGTRCQALPDAASLTRRGRGAARLLPGAKCSRSERAGQLERRRGTRPTSPGGHRFSRPRDSLPGDPRQSVSIP